MKSTETHIRNKITILTFISSILVIYIHTYNAVPYGIEDATSGFPYAILCIENFWGGSIAGRANALFFFISGLLFFRTFQIQDLFKKWKSRVKSILIPYVIWCSLYYLYYVAVTHIPFVVRLMNGNETIEFSITNWIDWLWKDQYFTLWFLKSLIMLIALAPVLWVLFNNHVKKIPTGTILLIVFILCLSKGLIPIKLPAGIDSYAVGAYIGMNHREQLKWNNKVASILGLLYTAFMVLSNMRFINLYTQILLFVAMWFALDLINLDEKKFPWWMSITFFTYVAHDVFLEMFEKIFLKLFGTQPIFALLDYIFMPIVTFWVLVLIAWLLRKCAPHVWKVVTGAR